MDSEGVFLNYAGYIISAEIFLCWRWEYRGQSLRVAGFIYA